MSTCFLLFLIIEFGRCLSSIFACADMAVRVTLSCVFVHLISIYLIRTHVLLIMHNIIYDDIATLIVGQFASDYKRVLIRQSSSATTNKYCQE